MDNTEKYEEQNRQLENSPEYKNVIDDVMREVYTEYTKWCVEWEESCLQSLLERIAETLDKLKEEKVLRNEDWRAHLLFSVNRKAEMWIEDKRKLEEKIKKSKTLLKTDPEKAADMFSMMGACHVMWGIKKRILKEKYGMTWYSPAEVFPFMCFD